jgi:hypothetical protein
MGRSVLLLLRSVMLVNEQGYDGRHQNGECNGSRKGEEIGWTHVMYNTPSTSTIIKAYNDKPPEKGRKVPGEGCRHSQMSEYRLVFKFGPKN